MPHLTEKTREGYRKDTEENTCVKKMKLWVETKIWLLNKTVGVI